MTAFEWDLSIVTGPPRMDPQRQALANLIDRLGALSDEDPDAVARVCQELRGLFTDVSQRNREMSELNGALENRLFGRAQELSLINERLAGTLAALQAEQRETERLRQELSDANHRLEAATLVDRLTGLPNLQYALHRLRSEIASARHFGHPLGVAMFAVEGFKEADSAFGPDAGNEILMAFGALLRVSFRAHDVVCHVGVEDFLVICPLTHHAGTVLLADRFRSALKDLTVAVGTGQWQGRASAGIAEHGPAHDTVQKLIQAATTRRWPLEP
jgi:hemerythrin